MSKPQIEFTMIKCELCKQETQSINLDKIEIAGIQVGVVEAWACDDCRKELNECNLL